MEVLGRLRYYSDRYRAAESIRILGQSTRGIGQSIHGIGRSTRGIGRSIVGIGQGIFVWSWYPGGTLPRYQCCITLDACSVFVRDRAPSA